MNITPEPIRRTLARGLRFCAGLLAGIGVLQAGVARAEVQVGGVAAIELSMGGPESSYLTNEIPTQPNGLHFSVRQVNLFLTAEPAPGFSFAARLQEDAWAPAWWSLPYFSMAALTWQPRDRFSITVGRFLSPFGLYPQRQLASDNLFASAPLLHGYYLPMSDRLGYWPTPGEGTFPRGDLGLTTLAAGAYVTGASANWTLVPDRLNLEAAVVNSALTSEAKFNSFSNHAVVARLGFQPVIAWQQGVSFSTGSFMLADKLNAEYGALGAFRQTLVGTDLVLGYGHVELSGEVVLALWNVPRINPDGTTPTEDGALVAFSLKNMGGYLDLKLEPPFLSGSYLALRYERLEALPYVDPQSGATARWDDNVNRVSIAAGIRLARPILLKLAFSNDVEDGEPLSLAGYALRGMAVVSF